MPIFTVELLMGLYDKGGQLGQAQADEAAMAALLHAVDENAAVLSRVEEQLQRLSSTPLHVGLAHLEDAASPEHDNDESRRYLSAARESFKKAAFSAPTGLLRSLAALLCAVSSLVLGHPASARRWTLRASETGDAALDEALAAVAPPPTPERPPSGWGPRVAWWWRRLGGGDQLTPEQTAELDAWYSERAATVESVVAVVQAARTFAGELDPSTPARPIHMLRTGKSDGRRILVLEQHSGTLPAGTSQLRVHSAAYHPHWTNAEHGTVEVRLSATGEGELTPSEMLLAVPVPAGLDFWWTEEPRPASRTVSWHDGELRESSYSPGGLASLYSPDDRLTPEPMTLETGADLTLLYDAGIHVFGDTLQATNGAPAVLVADCADRYVWRRVADRYERFDYDHRLAALEIRILPGPPRLDGPPPNWPYVPPPDEDEDDGPIDPRSDPIGWG